MTTTLGSIDAGSNAIRASIAVAAGPDDVNTLVSERVPVRLGRKAFTRGELDPATMDDAVAAFARFRKLFDQHGVARYRAVATSATRSARNRDLLLHRIFHEAGIELEVIDGSEEARLIRKAVLNSFRDRPPPHLVMDLGGGSLEVDIRRGGGWDTASLQIGTVRLLETLDLEGPISEDSAKMVRRQTAALLKTHVTPAMGTPLTPATLSGGNAEALAKIFGKVDERGMLSLETEDLLAELPTILALDVPERMAKYEVKQDRAEVMGAAALVIATVGEELNLRRMLVPGVGVRDGLLLDLAENTIARAASFEQLLMAEVRTFAHRIGHDTTHGEQVRKIARSLFDQLGRIHGLPEDLALVLEIASLMHDVGEIVNRRGHHKHGEYMMRWARIPGLEGDWRLMVAALIRVHRKSTPDPKRHLIYAELGKDQQAQVRAMAAILRMADSLDTDHRQRVRAVRAQIDYDDKIVQLFMRVTQPGSDLTVDGARKAQYFEELFGYRIEMRLETEQEAAAEAVG